MANGTLLDFLISGFPFAKAGYIKAYSAGTSTLKTLYTDRGQTIPAPLISMPDTVFDNAIALDANGVKQLYGTGLYKIVAMAPSGSTLYTFDYISLGSNDGSTVSSTDFASLNEAITSLGATEVILNIAEPDFPLTGNATVPSTLVLNFTYPGSIDQGAYTLAINSSFDAGEYQVFTGSGTVSGLKEARPEWFGNNTTPGTTDMADAIDAAAAASSTIIWDNETYYTSRELSFPYNNMTHIFNNTTITTDQNVTVFRVGASASSNLSYEHWNFFGHLKIVGAGTGNTSNHGLVFRNVSYGSNSGSIEVLNCGGKSFLHQAYARGNQYNNFSDIAIHDNFAGPYFTLDAGTTVGGYINDNTYRNIRIYDNEEGTKTHAEFIGTQAIGANRFYSFASESTNATDTLLSIVNGSGNLFYGLRLDGVTGTTTLNIASGQDGNLIFGFSSDGTAVDAAAKSVLISDKGTDDYPFVQLGSTITSGAPSDTWSLEVAKPGDARELHIRSMFSGGVVRYPAGTRIYIGDRDGSDNAPIEIGRTANRIDMRTLPAVAIGNGPQIRFDGSSSSSGDMGTSIIKQDANGVSFTFDKTAKTVHSSQGLSVADGVTAPPAVSGRAIIYVDTADGDLKVIFGDGTIKTLATDS